MYKSNIFFYYLRSNPFNESNHRYQYFRPFLTNCIPNNQVFFLLSKILLMDLTIFNITIFRLSVPSREKSLAVIGSVRMAVVIL